MNPEFQNVARTWETLGRDDPLWAVASAEDKRRGKWDLDEFFRTGEEVVSQYHHLLITRTEGPTRFAHVLDFGCGVGRLARAWCRRAAQVTGVDISSTMIEQGRRLLRDCANLALIINHRPDLSLFPDGEFDLVCSHICLQHIPWNLAAGYVQEFGRVCAPGGRVAFQLPSNPVSNRLPALRRKIVDSLPFGLGARYRRWRHGTAAVYEMHCTPAAEVERVGTAAGMKFIHKEPCPAVPGEPPGFYYLFRRPAGG